MKAKLLHFDPEGDLDLILKSPNAQARKWDANNASQDVVEDDADSEPHQAAHDNQETETLQFSSVTNFKDLETLEPIQANGKPNAIRMRVSSHHLRLASPVFKKMLGGPWREGASSGGLRREITTSEWNAQALVVLLDIIHGHHRAVPKTVSPEFLAEVATLVDYYNCVEVTEVFVKRWVKNRKPLPQQYGEASTVWLFIAVTFSFRTTFAKMARLALLNCDGPPQTMGLAIPQPLLDSIDRARIVLIDKVFQAVDNLAEDMCEKDICSPACSAMALGVLTTQMHRNGLGKRRIGTPYTGYKLSWLLDTVSSFSAPDWSNSGYRHKHCAIELRIKGALEGVRQAIDETELPLR